MPDLHNALAPLLALAAALLLVVRIPARLFPVLALVASALEVLRTMAILNLKVPVVGAAPLFAAVMVIGGAGSWLKTTGKVPVTAATVVTLVGALLLLQRLL
jgi:hypothetical protein